MKKILLLAAAISALSAPAYAEITTFATFDPIGSAKNLRWEKIGTDGGQLYTTSTGTATTPGSVQVSFSFTDVLLPPVLKDMVANFTFFAETEGDAAWTMSNRYIQGLDEGSFSFKSTQAFTFNNTFYDIGTNLLSGTFTDAEISGRNNSGNVDASVASFSGLTLSSTFYDFTGTIDRGFSLDLTAIVAPLGATAGHSLNNFRATTGGSFSSDPAPLFIPPVPEPEQWAMLIVGFGLVGAVMRRRERAPMVAA